MSSAPTELQRYALIGVRNALFDVAATVQRIKHQFPRLTHLATVVAGLAATIAQVDELTGDEHDPEPRPRARPASHEPAPVSRARRHRRPRRASRSAAPAPSQRGIDGKNRAWAAARDTLAVLAMSLDGSSIDQVANGLSTKLPNGTRITVSSGAARWRLNALVLRRQAALLRRDPEEGPIYRITDLGKQALKEDRDIRI